MIEQNIILWGRFKAVNLYNNTLHIIIYHKDGLRAAARLQEIEEGDEIEISLSAKEGDMLK